jgi:serine/threonine protein kinase
MTLGTVRGYTLIAKVAHDGSNPYFGASADGLRVFIRMSASGISDAKHAETVLQFLSRYQQLHHPSLIKVRDSWIEEGYLGLVTDFADGGCLADRLRQQGPFAGKQLVALFTPLSEAADLLHRNGIRHDAIKPANLLLRQDVPHLDVPRLPSSALVMFVSWDSYTAPEVLRNEETPQTDQYSLAASYVELRLGRRLFSDHPTDAQSMMKVLLEREPNLEPLPEGEQEVLRKALAKDPAERYPTCLTFLEELDRAVNWRRP